MVERPAAPGTTALMPPEYPVRKWGVICPRATMRSASAQSRLIERRFVAAARIASSPRNSRPARPLAVGLRQASFNPKPTWEATHERSRPGGEPKRPISTRERRSLPSCWCMGKRRRISSGRPIASSGDGPCSPPPTSSVTSRPSRASRAASSMGPCGSLRVASANTTTTLRAPLAICSSGALSTGHKMASRTAESTSATGGVGLAPKATAGPFGSTARQTSP